MNETITWDKPICHNCRRDMRYIAEYNRWWCDHCQTYNDQSYSSPFETMRNQSPTPFYTDALPMDMQTTSFQPSIKTMQATAVHQLSSGKVALYSIGIFFLPFVAIGATFIFWILGESISIWIISLGSKLKDDGYYALGIIGWVIGGICLVVTIILDIVTTIWMFKAIG